MGEEDEMIEMEAALDPDDHPYLVIYYLGGRPKDSGMPEVWQGAEILPISLRLQA